MEIKPSKGLKVKVSATREAIFGDESVSVQKVVMSDGKGVMTGNTLVGFCEIETLGDGQKHWYPIEDLTGDHGEKFVEEEIPIEADEGDDEEPE
jgi:hypothetical protein